MTNSLFSRHFLETDYKFVNLLVNFGIIKIEKNVEPRKLYEELSILKEKKANKNNLMNIKIEFSNEGIFNHILRKIG